MKSALAVDLDDRQPLAVARLQLGIAADVDLDELERMLGANLLEHLASPLAEVAAGGGEERDPSYG